jgi:plasmid stabilization system protein ParE
MSDESQFWVRSYVSSKPNHTHAVSLKLKPAQAATIDRMVVHLMVNRNLSRADALEVIFLAGTEALASKPDFGCPPEVQGALEVYRELARIQAECQHNENLEAILAAKGVEQFKTWANENGIEVDAFLENYRLTIPARPWAEMALDWLNGLLTDNGLEMPTDQIRSQAIAERIIDDSAADWDKLRQLASRNGLTGGRHGHWSLPVRIGVEQL